MSELREQVSRTFYDRFALVTRAEAADMADVALEAVIEALAAAAEAQEKEGVMGPLGTFCIDCPGMIQDFLRSHLPNETKATDASQHHQ